MLGFVPITLVHTIGYSATAGLTQTSAVSDAAARMQEVIGELSRSNERMQFLSGNEAEFSARLRTALDGLVTDDCQYAVPAGAVALASRLIRTLPRDLPSPEVAIDPDGAISLDWIPSRTRAFSISVGDSDRLAYAWMNGSDRGHGAVRFADSVPRSLLSQLKEIVAHDTAPLRVA